jgi:hypothetical protein
MEIWKENVEERILSSHHDGASMFEIIFMPPFHSLSKKIALSFCEPTPFASIQAQQE